MVAYRNMTGDANLSTCATPGPDMGRTCHAALGCHYRVLAYGAVVCHLYQVVEFGTFTDDCTAHYGAIYTRIGTDLYVIGKDYIA